MLLREAGIPERADGAGREGLEMPGPGINGGGTPLPEGSPGNPPGLAWIPQPAAGSGPERPEGAFIRCPCGRTGLFRAFVPLCFAASVGDRVYAETPAPRACQANEQSSALNAKARKAVCNMGPACRSSSVLRDRVKLFWNRDIRGNGKKSTVFSPPVQEEAYFSSPDLKRPSFPLAYKSAGWYGFYACMRKRLVPARNVFALRRWKSRDCFGTNRPEKRKSPQ